MSSTQSKHPLTILPKGFDLFHLLTPGHILLTCPNLFKVNNHEFIPFDMNDRVPIVPLTSYNVYNEEDKPRAFFGKEKVECDIGVNIHLFS